MSFVDIDFDLLKARMHTILLRGDRFLVPCSCGCEHATGGNYILVTVDCECRGSAHVIMMPHVQTHVNVMVVPGEIVVIIGPT